MDYHAKAFDDLVDHLLGPDFYIADPVNDEQATEIMVDRIKSIYPGVNESPVDKYRRRHKKCKWCMYCKSGNQISYPGLVTTLFKCVAKDKFVNKNRIRPFCSVFALLK